MTKDDVENTMLLIDQVADAAGSAQAASKDTRDHWHKLEDELKTKLRAELERLVYEYALAVSCFGYMQKQREALFENLRKTNAELVKANARIAELEALVNSI